MLKKLSLLLLVVLGLSATSLRAQDPGDPCAPEMVAGLQAALIEQGFDCLNGAGPFTCVDEVINYLNTNCPIPIDTTWTPVDSSFCDPVLVANWQNELIAQGYDCLVGAGPFACVEDVFNYAEANCPMPIDTTFEDECDPAVVSDVQQQLVAQGFTCLEGAGPFACVSDIFNYLNSNPACFSDSTWVPTCDSVNVESVQNELIAQGFACLEGVGPFACVEDIFNYLNSNPDCFGDSTWVWGCDSLNVDEVYAQLIEEGYTCLEGVGPFACVEDIFNYLNSNPDCYGDSTWTYNPCDPASVSALQEDLIAQGYDCLVGAGPFDCEDEVICFAMNNCQPPVDSPWVELPACLLDVPTTVVTFQQFLQYVAANCDSVYVPECFLSAPQFDTDEEFLNWIVENCPDDFNLITPAGSSNELVNVYSATRSTSGTKQPNTNNSRLTLTPNPATSNLTVRLSGGVNVDRIELLDLNGRLLLARQNVQNTTAVLPLDGVPAGLLLVKVYDQNGQVSTQKLVKQ